MIIFMEKGADKQTANNVAIKLASRGFEVRARASQNGDGIVLAALGIKANRSDASVFSGLPGVEECRLGFRFYGEHIYDFQDAHDFFSWGY